MRSRASESASTVLGSHAFTAASISAAVTRRPAASMSSRSNFFVASSSAASPRAATSSTMARVAFSTSAETSRFAARNWANRWAKSALLRSRRTGMAAFWGDFWPTAQWRGGGGAVNPPSFRDGPKDQTSGAQLRLGESRNSGFDAGASTRNDGIGLCPRPTRPKIVRAEVGQLAFQAFDVEPQRAAMAEQQEGAAAGLVAGAELDPDQFEQAVLRGRVDVAGLAGQHPVEPQRRDQPARRTLAGQRLLPVEPVQPDHQPLLALPPDDVAGLDAGFLHMRRDHREVIGIERDQFERSVHDRRDIGAACAVQKPTNLQAGAEPASEPVDVGALQDRPRIAVPHHADHGAAHPIAGRHVVGRDA